MDNVKNVYEWYYRSPKDVAEDKCTRAYIVMVDTFKNAFQQGQTKINVTVRPLDNEAKQCALRTLEHQNGVTIKCTPAIDPEYGDVIGKDCVITYKN